MRQLHVYDCALTGVMPMRVILATMLVVGGLAVAFIAVVPAHAEPQTCPPVCDQIPDSAWIQRRAVPLDSVYGWPALAGVAVQVTGAAPGPRFRFEELCATPPVPQDPRDSAVVARATVAHPDGQWQLQAQILHWRGDTASGGAIAASVFSDAVAALRSCQQRAPRAITLDHQRRNEPDGRGDQRSGRHAHLPGRPPGEQHDQRADALVVGAAAGAVAGNGGRPGAERHDRAPVRGLHCLVPVTVELHVRR